MKRTVVALALASLALSGCGDLMEPAAATVNGEKITIDEIEEELARYEDSPPFEEAAEQGDAGTLRRAYEQERLSRSIFRAVLEPEAEERGIEVTDEDVAAELEEIEADFASQGAFEEALKEQGLTPAQLEDLVYDQQLEERLKNDVTAELTPSDEELQTFYEENAQRYLETDASHIVLGSRADAARVTRKLARTPGDALESRFAELAREESIYNATAVGGGELGFLRSGEADPAFEQAAAQLAPGTVSKPVQTELGFEVILVHERRPIPFEDVRAEIIETLAGEERDRAWEEWLLKAYEDADIEVNPRYGELDPETFTITDPETSDLPGGTDVSPTETPAEEQPAG